MQFSSGSSLRPGLDLKPFIVSSIHFEFFPFQDIVERSLGRKLEEVFAEFDPNPLGAASIGQAHKARLHDGREVVVKVKFPSVERNFESDMNTITNFCRLAQPEHVSCASETPGLNHVRHSYVRPLDLPQVPFLKEVKKQFMTEFDYIWEAKNLTEVGTNMRRHFNAIVRKGRGRLLTMG